ncbi:MAG: hypothetical protein FWB72_04810 [Firmicutes bacterium]|nr:hypothetical protein [Bacillota bacterium]
MQENIQQACEFCFATIAEFNDIKLLGCERCYVIFYKALKPQLEAFHMAGEYVGKGAGSLTKALDLSTKKDVARAAEVDTDNTIISTRVRFARNISGYPFVHKLKGAEAASLIDKVYASAKEVLDNPQLILLNNITNKQKLGLASLNLISTKLLNQISSGGLILSKNKTISIMLNEEDHIRAQCILMGERVDEAFLMLDELDNILNKMLGFAFLDKLGFLTSCPTNLGTGLRVSVLLYLPHLTASGEILEIKRDVKEKGFAIRGVYGEGTKEIGAKYQLSNDTTLGLTEAEYINNLKRFTKQIVDAERETRLLNI